MTVRYRVTGNGYLGWGIIVLSFEFLLYSYQHTWNTYCFVHCTFSKVSQSLHGLFPSLLHPIWHR